MEGRPLEDSELAGRARRGDAAAYEELVRMYQDVAFRAAYLVTGNPDEAEEAAQEGFIKAYYALDRFKPGALFRPWLLRIVTNEARNRRRSAQRRGRLALQVAGDRPSDDAAPSPEVAALTDEDHRELLDALGALPEMDRLVIAYRYFFEMSEAEMAAALDCRPGTVKSRLSRALGRLREQLAPRREARNQPLGPDAREQRG
jgi:RNA polymerase sigma-70 factor (ECF subfamily)